MYCPQEIVVALGANLPGPAGPPEAAISLALRRLSDRGLAPRRISRFFRTPCFPPGAGPDYVNAAVVLRADPGRSPGEVLGVLHGIEAELDRRRERRWGGRTLDLDLLAFGELVLPDDTKQAEWRALTPERQRSEAPDELILPHPRLQDRGFVLVPMADVAAGWRHPALGLTVAGMLAALGTGELDGIVPI